MLGPMPDNWICGYLNSTLIVTKEDSGQGTTNIKFERMPCNQTTWMQAFTAPRLSAFAEDNAMASYFFLDQQMGPPPNMKTYLEVYF